MRTEIEKQQIKRVIVHFNCQERRKKKQKINHRRQSNHYRPTRAALCEREHGYTSSETMNDQIRPPEGVACAT
jgi:hypothetical protein